MNRCLICGQELRPTEQQYHFHCHIQLFGLEGIPALNYSWAELNTLAKDIIFQRVSVPGVQPKLSLHLEQTQQEKSTPAHQLTLVGLAGDFILKPPSHSYAHLPEWEHFCMLYAQRCKISVVPFGLIPLKSGELAYITRRMDRSPSGKLHWEDFCQLTNKMTEQKYNGSMELVGRTLRQFSSQPGLDAIRFFELAVFCFLTGNSDMHLKNFSSMRNELGEMVLTPAYDLVPVRMILPQDKEEMALTLNGKKSNLRWKDFQSFGIGIGLSLAQCKKGIARILEASHHQLPSALECSFLPQAQKIAFQQRWEARARQIEKPTNPAQRD